MFALIFLVLLFFSIERLTIFESFDNSDIFPTGNTLIQKRLKLCIIIYKKKFIQKKQAPIFYKANFIFKDTIPLK